MEESSGSCRRNPRGTDTPIMDGNCPNWVPTLQMPRGQLDVSLRRNLEVEFRAVRGSVCNNETDCAGKAVRVWHPGRECGEGILLSNTPELRTPQSRRERSQNGAWELGGKQDQGLTHQPGGQNLVLLPLCWMLSRVFLHQPQRAEPPGPEIPGP